MALRSLLGAVASLSIRSSLRIDTKLETGLAAKRDVHSTSVEGRGQRSRIMRRVDRERLRRRFDQIMSQALALDHR
jgi:hypothetical protein